MRIFYFANVRLPTEKAHGIQIVKNCEALAMHGFQVQLIVPARRNPDFDGVDPLEYYGAEKNFEIKTLSAFDPWWLIYGPQGIYIKLQSLLFMARLYLYLRKMISSEVESAVFYTREEYLLPLLQRFSDRVIWEAHNLPRRSKHYLKYWSKCLKIVAISKGLKEDLIKFGVDAEEIIVAPDGVTLQKFSAQGGQNLKLKIREELGLPLDKKIIMYTGNFFAWKGVYTLADASRHLPDNCLIVFVGGSPHELKKFENYIARRAIQSLSDRITTVSEKKIRLIEHVGHDLIPSYLVAADVLVLPNSGKSVISSKYTSPLKLFEYMAAGQPIVASYLMSTREILDDTTALFFTPDDPDDLARKIRQILDDKVLGQRLSQNALVKVRNYSWEKRAERILDAI